MWILAYLLKDNAFEFCSLKIFIFGIDSKCQKYILLSYAFRRNILHKEKDHLINDYEQNMKLLQTKHDADISLLKKEHALSASKVFCAGRQSHAEQLLNLTGQRAVCSHVEANYLAFEICLFFA